MDLIELGEASEFYILKSRLYCSITRSTILDHCETSIMSIVLDIWRRVNDSCNQLFGLISPCLKWARLWDLSIEVLCDHNFWLLLILRSLIRVNTQNLSAYTRTWYVLCNLVLIFHSFYEWNVTSRTILLYHRNNAPKAINKYILCTYF